MKNTLKTVAAIGLIFVSMKAFSAEIQTDCRIERTEIDSNEKSYHNYSRLHIVPTTSPNLRTDISNPLAPSYISTLVVNTNEGTFSLETNHRNGTRQSSAQANNVTSEEAENTFVSRDGKYQFEISCRVFF